MKCNYRAWLVSEFALTCSSTIVKTFIFESKYSEARLGITQFWVALGINAPMQHILGLIPHLGNFCPRFEMPTIPPCIADRSMCCIDAYQHRVLFVLANLVNIGINYSMHGIVHDWYYVLYLKLSTWPPSVVGQK